MYRFECNNIKIRGKKYDASYSNDDDKGDITMIMITRTISIKMTIKRLEIIEKAWKIKLSNRSYMI